MSKIFGLAFMPIKYIWVIGIVLALGLGTGIINIPGSASAQVALDCSGEVVDNECVQVLPDVCWNIDGLQTVIPDGYHQDASQRDACIKDPVPQVLGDSTDEPQVLAAETDGK